MGPCIFYFQRQEKQRALLVQYTYSAYDVHTYRGVHILSRTYLKKAPKTIPGRTPPAMAPPHAGRDRSRDHHPKRWAFPPPGTPPPSGVLGRLLGLLPRVSWESEPAPPAAAAATPPRSQNAAFSGAFFACPRTQARMVIDRSSPKARPSFKFFWGRRRTLINSMAGGRRRGGPPAEAPFSCAPSPPSRTFPHRPGDDPPKIVAVGPPPPGFYPPPPPLYCPRRTCCAVLPLAPPRC